MPQRTRRHRARPRALVTGASAGIGAAFARALAAQGHDLVIVARRRDRLEALAKEVEARHGVAAAVEVVDLAEDAELEQLAGAVAADAPDVLVNNAGFGTVGPFAELDPERELEQIRLNVVALVRLTRAALPGMLARGRGAVVNVSSLAGENAGPFTATYAATKAYVTRFSESLHEELRGSGVVVQALLPGFTRTEFQEVAGVDPGLVPGFAWLTPERVAETSLAALARGDAVCVPGAGYRLLGGMSGLAPRGLARRVLGALQRRSLRGRDGEV
jgi:short-subunit dehydrogenase